MSPHRNHVEARASRGPVHQYVSETHDHKPDAPNIRQRLILQSNGIIALETRQPGMTRVSGAQDLRFRIDLKTNKGWKAHAEYDSQRTARQAYGERNRFFRWRMIAFNQIGQVRLPDSWKGGAS
jgi:hypothetical protein